MELILVMLLGSIEYRLILVVSHKKVHHFSIKCCSNVKCGNLCIEKIKIVPDSCIFVAATFIS